MLYGNTYKVNAEIIVERRPGCNIDDTGYILNSRAKYTAVIGTAVITTANANLDGTGAIVSIIVASSATGTLIKSVTIKGQTSSDKGMVRFFVKNSRILGTPVLLIAEVEVPYTSPTGTAQSFQKIIDLNFTLKKDAILYATTEKSNTFHIIVECLEWAN